jgi:small conductance mechanosensitive channel
MTWDIEKLYGYMLPYIINIAAGLCIFIVGRLVARIISNLVARAMSRAKVHRTMILFLKHVIFYGLLTFTIIATLSKLGVETSSFIAVVGAASLAVGLALQGSLSNFAAGIIIILFYPFEVGDSIDAGGAQGLIEEIQIFNTILITPDKKRVILPNSKITGDKVTILPNEVPPESN